MTLNIMALRSILKLRIATLETTRQLLLEINMAVTYIWSITDTYHYEAPSARDGFISKVMWQCLGTNSDTGVSKSVQAGTKLFVAPSGQPKIPFSDVTEAEVLAWLFTSPGKDEDGDDLPSLVDKAAAEAFVLRKVTNTQVWSKPWAVPLDIDMPEIPSAL